MEDFNLEDFRRDVISYVNRLVEERLFNDPRRLDAVREMALHFNNHPNLPRLQRRQMIRETFDDRHHDLFQVYYRLVQDQYEPQNSPVERLSALIKIAKACVCIQLLELHRQRFPFQSYSYMVLSNEVNRFVADQITVGQLSIHLRLHTHELRQVPHFANLLEARVSRLTSLFRSPRAANNIPGAGNPAPQV